MQTNLIGGTWRNAIEGKTYPTIEPGTGAQVGTIDDSTKEDVDLAVQAARTAYEDGPWGRMSALERGRRLMKLAQLISDHAEEIATVESRDTGKPISAARIDLQNCARYFEFYGSAADKLHGEIIPTISGYTASVLREPHGVTGHIIPWNFPAAMFGRTLAPALATGNAVVIKPAEDACLATLRVAALAEEAGLPPGALNVITGGGTVAGAALMAHPGIDFASFTGSPAVGQIVQKLAADHFINCTLELGGKSPQVIFADADFDAAVPAVCRAIISNAGQICSAGSRVLIERSVYDKFVERLAETFSKARAGAPEMDLDCGPLISAKQLGRVRRFIEQARADNVPLLAEGKVAEGVSPNGFYVPPMLFGAVPRDNELAREEVFGPVLVAIPFDDEQDAVRLANATDYGLVAAVWTRDGGRQARVANKLRAGQVFINCWGAGLGVELPFGGIGKSGHGREKGFMALHEFTRTKTVVHNHGV